ncbi:MAG: hypothetical protein DMF84_28545 [Acidobacteria bacterium]|nr:MAG: hypothetical protein DMF84_28545 [Acidobacteriota bacterium]
MDLFDVIGPSADLKLNDSGVLQTFLNSVSDAFTSAQGTPTLLHGRRVEAMFAYVAAALGKCIAIKEEDAGDLYASSTDLQAPDYRLILNDETEILVEVKNCHKRRLTAPLTFSPQYIQKLRNYEATFRRPVYVATFWSRWSKWSLVPLAKVPVRGNHFGFTMQEAMLMNEMRSIGDHMIATTPPLILRLFVDPVTMAAGQNRVIVRTRAVEMYCGGRKVEDKFEKKVVMYFMLYGGWPQRAPVEIQDGRLMWIDHVAEPEQPTPGQGFEMIDFMSGLISSTFTRYTVTDIGEIRLLKPRFDPDALRFDIPRDYHGEDVPLWRFEIFPSSLETSHEAEPAPG